MFQSQLWPQVPIGSLERRVRVAKLHSPGSPSFPPNLTTAFRLGSGPPRISFMFSFSVPLIPSATGEAWTLGLIPPTHPYLHTPFTCLVPKACISIAWFHSSPPGLEGWPGGALQGFSLTCRGRTGMVTLSPRNWHSVGPCPSGSELPLLDYHHHNHYVTISL